VPLTFPDDPRPRDSRDGSLLLKPKQGFDSLRKDGWSLYTLGRRLGASDLGTYNPKATLPGGGKSDHAYNPARAFDLGNTQAFDVARAWWYYRHAKNRPEVEYVIYKSLIWSRDGGERKYTAGGHATHVHVSLRHPEV
jgi:hypothetical protein